tara:strand:+ start:7583 stop:9361 length:1779 start_codon:yes stop_codon:yes gene_type:complete
VLKTISDFLQIKYSSKELLDYIFWISIFWSFVIGFTISGSSLLVITFSLIVFTISYLASNKIKEITLEFSLGGLTLAIFFAVFLFQLLPSSRESLNTDHWYHLYAAYAPLELILEKFSTLQPLFLDFKIHRVFQIFSSVFLAWTIVFFIFYKLSRNNFLLTLFTISILVVAFKLFLDLYDTFAPHPELRTLPMLLLGTFGVNSVMFKFTGLLPVILMCIYFYEVIEDRIKFVFITCFSVFIPLVFFNIAIVEFSIWLYCFNVILLIELIRHRKSYIPTNNLNLLILGFTLISLIRQPAIFSFFPIFVYLVSKKQWQAMIFLFICLSIPLVQMLMNIYYGNPAITHSYSRIQLLLNSFSYEALISIFVNLSFLGLFAIFLLLPRKSFRLNFVLYSYLLIFWSIFHLIHPLVWGLPRYLIEYMCPLILGGAYLLSEKKIYVFYPLVSVGLLFSFFEISNNYTSLKADFSQEWFMEKAYSGERKYHSQIGADWDEALAKVPEDLLGKVIFDGLVFKSTPLILDKRVSLRDYISSNNLDRLYVGNFTIAEEKCEKIFSKLSVKEPIVIISELKQPERAISVTNNRWNTNLWVRICK